MAKSKAKAADPRRRAIIYAWVCPDTGEPVYVGKTSQRLETRQCSHRREASKRSNTPKHDWLCRVLAEGKEPQVIELERCTVEASSFVEREWIRLLAERFDLLNLSPGGGGNPGVGRIPWTPDLTAMLGTMSDEKLAGIVGCDRQTIAYRRSVLGIRKYGIQALPATTVSLSEAVISRLGKEPDYLIAQSIGISKFVIAKHRRLRGILPCATTTGRDGRVKLGDAKRLKPVAPGIMAKLGKITDVDFAALAGMTCSGVCQMRKRLGIPSYAAVRDKTVRQRRWAPRRRRKNVGHPSGHPAQAGFPF